MNNHPEPELLDHEYDGIRELDNKLPRWWVWLFYLSIIFAVFYMAYYHVFAKGDLATQGQMVAEYRAEMKAGEVIKVATMSKFEAGIPGLQPSQEPALIESGRLLYVSLCAPCHRLDGGGLVGPNLCDDYWIHGGNFTNNVLVIWNGVPSKGMVTWKNTLKPDQIFAAASYIQTLRGTNPKNPKPPENQAPVKTGPSEFE